MNILKNKCKHVRKVLLGVPKNTLGETAGLISLSEAHKVSESFGKGQIGEEVESRAAYTLSDSLTAQIAQHTGGG